MTAADDGRRAYQDIFEASPDPIFVHDADTGEVVQANPAAAEMLGLEPASVVGMSVGEFSPPGYSTEDANELITTAHETGQSHVEWRVDGPDGETRWTSVTLKSATVDGVERVIAYAKDVTEYRLSEQKHRTERNLLDRLLDVSPVGIVIHDADGTILRTNEQAESILGVDREELSGDATIPGQLRVLSVEGDPLSADEVPAEVVRRTGSEIQDRELTIERADGERVVVSTSATPLFDSEGTLQRIVVSIADISERRERERRRKERNEQLRTLVDNLPVVVFTLGPDGVFTHSTGRGLKTLGLEPNELVGVSVFDAYADYPDIIEAAERALDGEEVRATQQVDDLTFETWYQPVFDEDGDLTNVVAVARDITELKRRETRVKELSDATRELLHAETEQDVADTVTTIAQQIVGRPLAALWTYDEADETLSPAGATAQATAFANAEAIPELPPMGPETDEYAIFEAGETTVIEDYRDLDNPSAPGVPLRTLLCLPLGEHGLLCIGTPEVERFEDTERSLLEILGSTATAALEKVHRAGQLREHRRELERSNEALQQFAYIASHDLQEPLRMVSSYIDLLETEYGDQLDDEAQEYMDFAVDGATRMKEMIDGLLTYSRVATQGSTFEPVEPTDIVEQTLGSLSLFLEDAETTVEYDTLPTVEADPLQLEQVFQNLLNIAVTHGEASTVTIDATVEGDTVEFAVSDDGVGIPEHEQDDIFGIFEQGYEADDGSGIGLAVCERVFNRHDGEIWVESTPGEGTTFFFTVSTVAGGKRDD